jgi:hydrophobe/amphiphile efflux-1 (HAE1) family protein
MNITEICVHRPVLAWMIMCGTILFGILAVTRIGVSQFPDVDNPTVSVSVSWPGAAPEDCETSIVNQLEDAMSQVTGVTQLQGQARIGSARVTATFDISRNIDLALQDTQAKIAQIQRSLPLSSLAPIVSKSNPDDQPIMTVGISGPFSRQLLADVARYQVMDMLETLPGVGQITTMGYLDRNIRIWVDADKLVATGTTVTDVISAVQKQHISMPGGELDAGGLAFDVRVVGEVPDLETMRNIVIRNTNNSPVHLKDVALVQDGFQDVTNYARSNGETVQGLGILKQPGSNAVGVANSVRTALATLQKTLPPGMKAEVIFDTTGFISESVNEIGLELGLAVILTAFVCWIFLGSLSSTMNVLFAIPMSLLGTIAILYFAGFTLNTFTLLGLSLAVGLVVDDAVMVMENIFRHAEMGKDRVTAATEGTKEITFAALAATIAVIAIFMPVAFMSGVIGKFFLQFGVTLSVAVAISYVEAITLAPARCAQMLRTSHEARGVVGRLADRGFEGLSHGYAWALARSLKAPWLVLATAVAVLALSAFTGMKLKQEFVPSQDQSRLSVRLSTVVGANLSETDKLVRQAEDYLNKQPEVIDVMSNVSAGGGNFFVTLVPPNQRSMGQNDLAAKWRKAMNYPGLRVSVQDLSQQGFAGSKGWPVQFSVEGSDWDTLVALSKKLKDETQASGLVTDIESDYALGAPELVVSPDRARASDVGVTVSDIATTVSSLVGGIVIGQYSNEGRRMDINLRLQASQRTRPEDLSVLRVRSSSGTLVPLSSVVKQVQQPELQEINHANRARAITITGNVAAGHAQNEALAFVQTLTSQVPPGYQVVLGGNSSQFGDAMTSLLFALMVGILVAYMVLASQFNSFLHPVTVLTILPLSIAGAMFALYFAGKTLNVFSMIGLLLLMGIVKKNSIILVDYANEIRSHEHLDAHEAMLRAGPIRLRPILMTAVATLMAAVPSALGMGPGAETRGPMADAVIGGLVLSTALSLLVVPCFYVVADRMKMRLGLGKAKEKIAPVQGVHAGQVHR